MGKSGKRARALDALLEDLVEADEKPDRPSMESISSADLAQEVRETYRRLGGIEKAPRIAAGPWDFAFNGMVIELDEENHFNRHRAETLDSSAYDRLGGLDVQAYRSYCEAHEGHCLTYGGYWTNASTERAFGSAGAPGNLSGPGAPRWKQRAFYDYVKDLAPITDDLVVSRLAVWDTIEVESEAMSLRALLLRAADEDLRDTAWPSAVLSLAEDRAMRLNDLRS